MIFSEKIKRLRAECQMFQKQYAVSLGIDTATYCKMEKGKQKVRHEQIEIIAKLLQIKEKEFFTLWLANMIIDVVKREKELENKVLEILKMGVKEKKYVIFN